MQPIKSLVKYFPGEKYPLCGIPSAMHVKLKSEDVCA